MGSSPSKKQQPIQIQPNSHDMSSKVDVPNSSRPSPVRHQGKTNISQDTAQKNWSNPLERQSSTHEIQMENEREERKGGKSKVVETNGSGLNPGEQKEKQLREGELEHKTAGTLKDVGVSRTGEESRSRPAALKQKTTQQSLETEQVSERRDSECSHRSDDDDASWDIDLSGSSSPISEDLSQDFLKTLKQDCFSCIKAISSSIGQPGKEALMTALSALNKLIKGCPYFGFLPTADGRFGETIVESLMESKIDVWMFNTAMEILPLMCEPSQPITDLQVSTLIIISSGLLNFTDESDGLSAKVCSTPNFLEALAEVLVCQLIFMKSWLSKQGDVARNFLGVIYNCSLYHSNRHRLREVGLIWMLKKILVFDDLDNKLTATIALAGILNEEESKFFEGEMEAIHELVKILGRSLEEPDRRCDGWSAKELAAGCSRLAGNDVNKVLLVNAGVLDHLCKLCAVGNDLEQIEALGALWALTFDDANRTKMVANEAVIDAVTRVKEFGTEVANTQAVNVLWMLREELSASSNTGYQQTAKELTPKISHSEDQMTTNHKHLMISYNWGSKVTVFNIHDSLVNNGYRVWIDRNEMKGSIMDSIADGVENAEVLLMCISAKYKDSKYCRAEAEYAFENDIDIVPLLMEADYKADGWLGLIKGTRKHFNFSKEQQFGSILSELVKELGDRGKSKQKPAAEPKIIPVQQPVLQTTLAAFSGHSIQGGHGHALSHPANQVAAWTTKEVQKWLHENQCYSERLKDSTGSDLLFLKNLRQEAPQYFYNYLDSRLNITELKQLSRLTEALKSL